MHKNQLPSYGESLASKFPEIAKEWCYEKNGNLIPETTFAGSHKEVFWKCAECGQIYIRLPVIQDTRRIDSVA
ncbi:zinc-ribbon domain-containing protein [Marseilla massiliensis]|uniref:Zinc-ribbon domain-containing protein n=1 Tax=Marseilla massiliensis TaxID=1841864 RepID=A0A939B4D2_9BACT|nr:zinc-ribbon domain-containing protein [Marseilla massiliensis]